jgi:hypothetical protein
LAKVVGEVMGRDQGIRIVFADYALLASESLLVELAGRRRTLCGHSGRRS